MASSPYWISVNPDTVSQQVKVNSFNSQTGAVETQHSILCYKNIPKDWKFIQGTYPTEPKTQQEQELIFII